MARTDSAAPSFSDYFTIGEAAEYLGVSAATLRNWDRSGKLKPRRHPQNGYRIYLHEDLAAVLKSAKPPHDGDATEPGVVDWYSIHGAEHFVQFFESNSYLVDTASGFIGAALRTNEIGVVIATPEHRRAIESKLTASGIDVGAAVASGQFLVQDARELLSQFMVDGRIDEERFDAAIGQKVVKLAADGRHIHAFGEMVTILWQDGNCDGAIALEQLWGMLAERHQFAVLCAYPIQSFSSDDQSVGFDRVCSCHTHIHPTESFSRLGLESARLKVVSKLQQQILALRSELEHRMLTEQSRRDVDRYESERLARIASELRPPVAAIETALQELAADNGIGPVGREAILLIRHQIERLMERIEHL